MKTRRKILLAGAFFLLIAGYSNCSGSGFKVESALSSVSGQGEVKNSDPSNPTPNPAPNPNPQSPSNGTFQILSLATFSMESAPNASVNLTVRLNYTGTTLSNQYQVFMEIVNAATPNAQSLVRLANIPGPLSSQWQGTVSFNGTLTSPAPGSYILYAGVSDTKITSGSNAIQIQAGPGVTANYTMASGYRYQIGTLTVKAPLVNKNLGRILPVGDSITASCGDCNPSTGYRGLLADQLRSAGFTFQYVGSVNDGTYLHEGHGGWCLTQKGSCPAGLYDFLMANNAEKLLSSNPDTVLLMGGANDSWQFALSPVETLNKSATDFVADYFKMIDFILATRKQVRIFVAGTPPFSGNFAGQEVLFQKTNPMIRDEIARRKDSRLIWVDIHKAFENSDGTLRADVGSLFVDGVHPNRAGYQMMADRWFQVINSAP